ncbi:LamG domain-containing protein [Kibdelosporangium persicum]|uniref:LamG domain-containing protein n=1 Tax=Kibdelosporangium persicum TaxID=2698649 RepID=UPI00156658BB|nr:LamG domain-containing protein [Kibdelosporangium persicum]
MLLAGIVSPLPVFAGSPAAAAPEQVSDEASALKIARQSNKPVRVLSQTDETNEVVANPDGRLTWTQHARPVRIRQGDDWSPVDATLVRRPDGTVAPKAASVDLTLSGGGDKSPIVKVGRNGIEVGLGWSRPLPEPRLEGATAIYPEVLPGVDLKVTVNTTGFNQVLVVKTAEAARNPELKRVSFGSYGKGAKVRAVDGRLEAGADGPVFTGDASRMWDSSGPATERDRLTGKADGDRSATMGVEVSDAAVAIMPDQAFLAAPETKFPVYLDPSYGCNDCGKAHHMVVQSAWPTAKNFDRTDGALGDLKAGYICDGPCFISRTYLRMKTAKVIGKTIHSAGLHLDVVHAADCNAPRPTELWSSSWFDANSDYDNQPGWRVFQGSASSCNGMGIDLEAGQAVREAASNAWWEMALVLKGADEGGQQSWRRFTLNPSLVIWYNGRPDAPYDMGVNGWGDPATSALPCKVGAERPFVGTRSPRLRARVSDPESREFGGLLNLTVDVTRGPWDKPDGDLLKVAENNIPAGSYGEVTATLPGEGVYNWRAITGDYELLSDWSPYCEFEIDTVAPYEPEVTSGDYPSGRDSGGVGKLGYFTFKPHWRSHDTAYYLYSFTTQGGDDPQIQARPRQFNGPAMVKWAPTVSGPQFLSVRTVDRAGNRSPIVRYRIDVSDYQVGVSGKVAKWSFDDSLQDVSDAKTLVYTGPGTPDGTFGEGKQGTGAVLDSISREAYHAKDSLVRTDSSFTVSAWAKLDANDANAAVVSQDGARTSGLKMLYDDQADRWALTFDQADSDNTTVAVKALSSQPPNLHTWTHLTGVYDVATRKARIYVNGQVAGEADVPATPWNSAGPFVVGAAKVNGMRAQYLTGSVDTVRAHGRALTGAEVATLYNGTSNAAPAGEYLFEGNLTNTGANSHLTAAAPGYDTGYATKGLKLEATNAQRPATSTAVLNTRADFSVAAWVKLADKNNRYTVVSQDASVNSGFVVQYDPAADRWVFGLAAVNEDPAGTQWVRGTSSPEAGQWTHIAAVHDNVMHKMSLYVNGVREAEADAGGTTANAGPFVIGANRADNTRRDLMNGVIDEINVYDGALKNTEVGQLATVPVERNRYKFDDTSGQAAANSVAGGAPGSLYGTGVKWGQSGGSAAAVFDGNYVSHMGTVAGAGPLGRWTFDNTTNDGSGNGRNLVHRTRTGDAPANYADDRHGRVVTLNGDQHLQHMSSIVDTTKSFSVSAWASLDRATGQAVIVSQDGTASTPFRLMYSTAQRRWAFSVSSADGQNPATADAYSRWEPKTGVLTHLLGVYDSANSKVLLYVNGYIEGEAAAPTMWQSTGAFTVGRARWNGTNTDYFPGRLDEVRVYDRVLGPADAHGLWNLGSNVVTPFDSRMRADKSWTVAAWVRADEYSTHPPQAIAFGAINRSSPLMLGYIPESRRWGVTVDISAGPDHQGKRTVSDNEAHTYGDANGWVHLAATYDAVNRKVELYVNGDKQTSAMVDGGQVVKVDPANPHPQYAGVNTTIVTPGRDLLMGRATWDGQPTGFWKGGLRDVRVFTGVLPEACGWEVPVCLNDLRFQ